MPQEVADLLSESTESVSLAEKLMEAFYEGATIKTAVQGLLRAAQGVSRHPNVPKTVKEQLTTLRTMLTKTWADLEGEGEPEAAPVAEATATEAATFNEEGVLVTIPFAEAGAIVPQ